METYLNTKKRPRDEEKTKQREVKQKIQQPEEKVLNDMLKTFHYLQHETQDNEIKKFIQKETQPNNLSAGHCVEIKFNLSYDYQMSSLVKISRHLLKSLKEAMTKKYSIKILIDGVIRNTYTGETMERRTPFPNHMFQV